MKDGVVQDDPIDTEDSEDTPFISSISSHSPLHSKEYTIFCLVQLTLAVVALVCSNIYVFNCIDMVFTRSLT